jgi:hypothetical protein
MESYLGHGLEFNKVTVPQAQHMLRRVRAVLNEQRTSSAIWNSHRDPGYLKLVMMEQALQQHVDENVAQAPVAIDVNDPKTKATMKKAEQGRPLNPDEQKTITAMAMMKKEGAEPIGEVNEKQIKRDLDSGMSLDAVIGKHANKRLTNTDAIRKVIQQHARVKKDQAGSRRMVKEQNELQQAQVVLAAQDMIDRIQGMIEDVSEMQYKDLPALSASIKADPNLGADKAAQFQSQATGALTELLNSLQAGKTGLESAQGVLTGQTAGIQGLDAMAAGTAPAGGDELDLSLDANLEAPVEPEEPKTEPDETSLGRKRR